MRAMRFAAGVTQQGGAGELFKRASMEANKTEEVHIEAAIKYLTFVVLRRHVYHSFPFYLLFLILITLFFSVERYDNKEMATMNEFVEDFLFQEQQQKDATSILPDDVWVYIQGVYSRLNDAQPSSGIQGTHPNSPLLTLLLRQYRRPKIPCGNPQYMKLLPDTLRNDFMYICVDITQTDTEPIVHEYDSQNITYYANRQTANTTIPGSAVSGKYTSFTPTNDQFTITVPYNMTNDQAAAFFAKPAQTWIDEKTAAIILECFLFNSVQNYFVHVTTTFEFHPGGKIIAMVRGSPFHIFDRDNSMHRFLLAVDIALLLMSVWVFYEAIRTLRFVYILQDDGAGMTMKNIIGALNFWSIFDFALAALLLISKVIRIYLTSSTFSVDLATYKDPSLSFFMYMCDYAQLTDSANDLLAWSLLLGYLRVFMYARYNFRLSVISETVISSIHDLIGVCVIICFVLLSYGVAGHYLWGFFHESFYSVDSSLVFLFQIMISGELQDYDSFSAYHVVYTPLFFLSFILISWLVILNVAVGILAGSFGAVVDTFSAFRTPDWSVMQIFADVYAFVVKRLVPKPLRKYCGADLNDAYKDDERTQNISTFVTDRLELIQKLRLIQMQDVIGPTPEYITFTKFAKLAGRNFTKPMIQHIFTKAQQQIGTGNARLRQLRMTKQQLDSSLKMKAHLMQQAKLVTDIHKYVTNYDPSAEEPKMNQHSEIMNHVRDELHQMQTIRSDIHCLSSCVTELQKRLSQHETFVSDMQTALRQITTEVRPGAPHLCNKATSPPPSPRRQPKKDQAVQVQIISSRESDDFMPHSILVKTVGTVGPSGKYERQVSHVSNLSEDEWGSDASSGEIEQLYEIAKQQKYSKPSSPPMVTSAEPISPIPTRSIQQQQVEQSLQNSREESMTNPLVRDNEMSVNHSSIFSSPAKEAPPVASITSGPLLDTQFAMVRNMATAPPSQPQFRNFSRMISTERGGMAAAQTNDISAPTEMALIRGHRQNQAKRTSSPFQTSLGNA